MAALADTAPSTGRRDQLLSIQRAAQERWEQDRVFEVDAPDEGAGTREEKFFGTFPYPYMNGRLHVGHAFSVSKLEFAAAYHRLCKKNVLFPQGFHCTGMPIKACADRLKREIELYGDPPAFSVEEDAAPEPEKEAESTGPADPTKFTGKKSKAASKKGSGNTQWAILEMSGIPTDEISRFSAARHWLDYFPPMAVQDLKAMGCGIDWRRSFITTDVNPYYDSFVRWQFWTLYKQGKIVKDKRYAVYSPKDGQPCADHDRSSGEGVGPQEYTLIKMEALELNGALADLQTMGRVFLLAATLRPETMYGQTNCWALPEGEYGAFRGMDGEVYVMTHRSALNLSFQDRMPVRGQPECLLAISGQDLIGTPLRAPNCPHERIYVLPLLTILTTKGTGVVTSVPSDSPDDYIALQDLKKKPKLREKYGVRDEWVMPFEVLPIINIPEFGDKSAEKVCVDLKIQSQNDKAKLEEAKGMTYLKGFTEGVMLVGDYAGSSVRDVKPKIKAEMVAKGEAIIYSEPEKQVMSRSGDQCVVALTDQWYLTYGEEEWRKASEECLARMEVYSEESRNSFLHTLGWLEQWACSRSFGLGTWLPWDPAYLIESLSDSTIYMAYYTVAHFLQHGDMYGAAAGPIAAEQMTPEVWDYIFLDGEMPADCGIAPQLLRKMHREFEYWYPFDLRVSGKDLIQNHLTFALYNHTAVWKERPDLWPRSFRCNGHLQIDGMKMAKHLGNFITLNTAVLQYSADAMRFTLADAGDGLDDANFETTTANSAILRLTKELGFIEEMLAAAETGQLRGGAPSTFHDRSFDNAINLAVKRTKDAYDSLLFREALKHGCYELQNARDLYRKACGEHGMCRAVVERYMEVSTLLLEPVCPHTCDHVWTALLRKPGCVLVAGWPAAPAPDMVLLSMGVYLEKSIGSFRSVIQKLEAPKKKKKDAPTIKVTHGVLVVSERFAGWRETVLLAMAQRFSQLGADNFSLSAAMDAVLPAVAGHPELEGKNEKAVKQTVMPFAKMKAEEAISAGGQALATTLPFNEAQLLHENAAYIKAALGLVDLQVFTTSRVDLPDGLDPSQATPGVPVMHFTSGP